jgi:hypothetical protein
MARFEKFDPREHIRGLAEAAAQIQIEELTRAGKMPSLNQVFAAIDETRKKFHPFIVTAQQKQIRPG